MYVLLIPMIKKKPDVDLLQLYSFYIVFIEYALKGSVLLCVSVLHVITDS